MAQQLLNNTNNITLSIINSKGIKTVLKNFFPLWKNGKKKVNILGFSSNLEYFNTLIKQFRSIVVEKIEMRYILFHKKSTG